MTDKKYELTENSKEVDGVTVYQIRALKDFNDVKAGDLGGYVESEENLNQEDDCWIYDEACAFGNAEVSGDSTVRHQAKVRDEALVEGETDISENAIVKDWAAVYDGTVSGNAVISGSAEVNDATVSGNALVSDDALVSGGAEILGDYKIIDEACINDNIRLEGYESGSHKDPAQCVVGDKTYFYKGQVYDSFEDYEKYEDWAAQKLEEENQDKE